MHAGGLPSQNDDEDAPLTELSESQVLARRIYTDAMSLLASDENCTTTDIMEPWFDESDEGKLLPEQFENVERFDRSANTNISSDTILTRITPDEPLLPLPIPHTMEIFLFGKKHIDSSEKVLTIVLTSFITKGQQNVSLRITEIVLGKDRIRIRYDDDSEGIQIYDDQMEEIYHRLLEKEFGIGEME